MRELNEVDETLFGESSGIGTATSTNDNTSTLTEVSPQHVQQGKERLREDHFEVVMNKASGKE